MPLAGGAGAGAEGDAAVVAEADGDMLGRIAHGRFDVDRHADAAQLAPPRRFRAPLGEARPAGEGQAVVEIAGVVARVVGDVDWRLVGHRRRRDQVAPADLVGREAERDCGLFHQALDHVVRFRNAGATVGIGEDGVGEHALDLGMDRGRAVGVRQHARVQQGGRDGPQVGDVGAEVGERAHAQAEELPVGIQRQRAAREMVARLRVAEKALAAPAQPAHRPPQPARGPGHEDLLMIGKILHAEAAAEIVGEDAEAVLLDPEDAGDDGARAVHVLAVNVEGVALAFRIVDAERAARLDGAHDEPVVDQLDLDHVGCRLEGGVRGIGIAVYPGTREVARRFRPDFRRARLAGFRGVDHGGQGGVLHVHQLRRVLRRRAGLGHDHGHRLAHVAHAIARQHRVGRIAGGAAVRPRQRHEGVGDAGQRAEAVRHHVRAGVDGEHAVRRGSRRSIDRRYVRMGVGRAHEAGVHLAVERDVVLKPTAALEKRVVFLAWR